MSRRKRHWLKVLGAPAAPRHEASKEFQTHETGAGGYSDKVLLNVPHSNIRGSKSTEICTRPMSERKLALVTRWIK